MTKLEAKWEVFDRCNQDKTTAKSIWDLLYKRCNINNWPEKWSNKEIQEFRKYLNLLLPTQENWSKILNDIKEVFGEVEEKK